MTDLRLYVGVHVCQSIPEGPAIQLATQVWRRPPWLLPAGPATHAFVSIHSGGLRLRLDGQPPRSVLGWDWHRAEASEARWEVVAGNGVSLAGVLDAARRETGVAYDLAEAIAQAMPIPGVAKVGPWLPGHICTRVVTEILKTCGTGPAALVAALPDLFPETLAQALGQVTAPWCRRLPSLDE